MIKTKRIISCVLAGLVMACGEASDASEDLSTGEDRTIHAIHGGKKERGYPAVGQFDRDDIPEGYCTGTLIDPNWVLTARHCQKMLNFLTGPNAKSAVAHPLEGTRYTQPTGGVNEVTLVRLATPIRDVPLARLNDGPLPRRGASCIAVGYGLHDNGDGTTSKGIKRSAILNVVSADQYSIMTKARTGSIDSGDSGGPLLCGGKVAGVARLRNGDYSPIDFAWIQRTIADPRSAEQAPETPVEPELSEFAAPFRVLGSSGALCPSGSITLDEGLVYGPTPEPAQKNTTQTCKIQLAVSIPAGRSFEKPVFCSTLDLIGKASQASATLAYAIAGDSAVRVQRSIVRGQSDHHCDTLDLSAPTCEDPASPSEVAMTLEITAPMQAGSSLVLSALETSLRMSGETYCPTRATR